MVEAAQAASANAGEESKQGETTKKMKTNVNKNVVVRERDFKSATTHQANVTGITRIDEDEFITSSLDCSLKLWDKFTQGVSYTYETHEPLSSMQTTGEKGELLVCGQG